MAEAGNEDAEEDEGPGQGSRPDEERGSEEERGTRGGREAGTRDADLSGRSSLSRETGQDNSDEV